MLYPIFSRGKLHQQAILQLKALFFCPISEQWQISKAGEMKRKILKAEENRLQQRKESEDVSHPFFDIDFV